MESVNLKFQITRGDLVLALIQQALRSSLWWLVLGVFVIRLAMEMYYLITLGEIPDGNVFSPWIAIALIFFGVFPFLVVRLRADKQIFVEQTWHFANEGITFVSGEQSAQIAWRQIEKIMRAGSFYQLHFSKQNVALIPRRVFANAQAESGFQSILQRKVKTNFK